MRLYQQIISEATGYKTQEALRDIEECMREDIFHSTLDWQTREELMTAARLAVKALKKAKLDESLRKEKGK